jgi:hypothetical protein
VNANDPSNQTPPDRVAGPTERWGSWEDAEHWRKESFLRRTPAQRLAWLEDMMDLVRIGHRSPD